MTAIVLLNELKAFCEANTADLLLPVNVKMGDPAEFRAPRVYLMRVPYKSGESDEQQVPLILLRFETGLDEQERGENTCVVRLIAAAYSEDEEEGALHVLNILTRLRVALMKQPVIGGQFTRVNKLEYLVYPDSKPPFYFGEMMTEFRLPEIRAEVRFDI